VNFTSLVEARITFVTPSPINSLRRRPGEFFKPLEIDGFKGIEFDTFKIGECSARTFESVMVLTCSQNCDEWVFA
jgi:hypothetical protein